MSMKYLIIDVREPFEYAAGHVDGSINIPLGQLGSSPSELSGKPKDTPIIVYCRSGNRSNAAKGLLESQGYEDVTDGINQENVSSSYNL